jgi:hypothetical protein
MTTRKLNESEMKEVLANYKTNPLLSKIVHLEHEVRLIDLRRRYADISEEKDLNKKIKKCRDEQHFLWYRYVESLKNAEKDPVTP